MIVSHPNSSRPPATMKVLTYLCSHPLQQTKVWRSAQAGV